MNQGDEWRVHDNFKLEVGQVPTKKFKLLSEPVL